MPELIFIDVDTSPHYYEPPPDLLEKAMMAIPEFMNLRAVHRVNEPPGTRDVDYKAVVDDLEAQGFGTVAAECAIDKHVKAGRIRALPRFIQDLQLGLTRGKPRPPASFTVSHQKELCHLRLTEDLIKWRNEQKAPALPSPAPPTPAPSTPASPTPASPTPAPPSPASTTPAQPSPASTTPAQPLPAPTTQGKRGRKPINIDDDSKIMDAWKTEQYKGYSDLAKAFGKQISEVKLILDRESKRRKKSAKK